MLGLGFVFGWTDCFREVKRGTVDDYVSEWLL
jgi:hypothetical protein